MLVDAGADVLGVVVVDVDVDDVDEELDDALPHAEPASATTASAATVSHRMSPHLYSRGRAVVFGVTDETSTE